MPRAGYNWASDLWRCFRSSGTPTSTTSAFLASIIYTLTVVKSMPEGGAHLIGEEEIPASSYPLAYLLQSCVNGRCLFAASLRGSGPIRMDTTEVDYWWGLLEQTTAPSSLASGLTMKMLLPVSTVISQALPLMVLETVRLSPPL